MDQDGGDQGGETGAAGEQPTYNQVIEFLDAKGVTRKCECCGSDKWYLETEHWDGVPALPYLDRPTGSDIAFARKIVLTACQNCGNMRTYLSVVIRNWLRSQKSDAPASEVNDD